MSMVLQGINAACLTLQTPVTDHVLCYLQGKVELYLSHESCAKVKALPAGMDWRKETW